MPDKRMSEDEVAAELRDGMTIGVGGWGSRRKPMALVQAIARSALRDLTVISFGGPDVGLLCAAGKVKKLEIPDLDPQTRTALENNLRSCWSFAPSTGPRGKTSDWIDISVQMRSRK